MTSATSVPANRPEPRIAVFLPGRTLPDDAIVSAATGVVVGWWSEEDLPGTPKVEVLLGQTDVAVELDGIPLTASGRRRAHAVATALGEPAWKSTAALSPTWAEDVWVAHADRRPSIAGHLVDAILRASATDVRGALGIPRAPAGRAGPIGVELSEASLRKLTMLSPETVAEAIAGVAADIYGSYGVPLPDLALLCSRDPAPHLRLHFDGVATQAFLVEDEPTALLADITTLLTEEVSYHLALWVGPEADTWDAGLGDLDNASGIVAQHLPELKRRLLSQRVSVLNTYLLAEAILRVMADRSPAVGSPDADLADDIEDLCRVMSGQAVLDRLCQLGPPYMIAVEELEHHSSSAALRAALVERYPYLCLAQDQVVLQVPGANRRAVAAACRPLADVVRVVADGELKINEAVATRWDKILTAAS